MRGNASRHPDNRITVAQAKAQMVAELCNCTDARLAALTVDHLLGRFRVNRKTAEYELLIERQRRSRA